MPEGCVLITMIGGYGDAFLAIPSIREVAKRFGSENVYLLCPEEHISAFFTEMGLNPVPILPGSESLSAVDLTALSIQQVISFNVYYPCEIDQQVGEILATASWREFFD